jgi:exodeoxyribonuclease V beta subunit
MLGIRGNELFETGQDETRLEEWIQKFSLYHQEWQQYGFIRMFKRFMHEEQILVRLMSYPDGERRITNILHLSEVLNQTEITRRLGMSGLLKWLTDQRQIDSAPTEEHQLRLESDENAVKLITMHMSKGLEFPIVFCPFAWSGSFLWNADTFAFHDENKNRALTLDLGSEHKEHNKAWAEKEELAENLRLLYVAITRAKNRCYLVWGRFYESASSAAGYLLHQPPSISSDNPLDDLKRHIRNLGDEEMLAMLHKIEKSSHDNLSIVDIPEQGGYLYRRSIPEESQLQSREFSGSIEAAARIASYSSLVSKHPHGAEIPDHDIFSGTEISASELTDIDEDSDALARTIHNLPRGAKTGTFIHAVLQDLDFTISDATAIESLIASKLQSFGFDRDWLATIYNAVHNICHVPVGSEKMPFFLHQIDAQNRLNELEFYFPLNTISGNKLSEKFRAHGPESLKNSYAQKIAELTFAPLKGFMKGFIDLVFRFENKYYIIDWKSNHLGNRYESYNQQALTQAMLDNLYFLQYHIYTVALDQYLKIRLPDYSYNRHFGGVLYIFVRGVDRTSATQNGIYKDRPTPELIKALSELLVTKNA